MVSTRSSWFDEVRASDPSATSVAVALGMTVRRGRASPCPKCGKDKERDGRFPVRLWQDSGFVCSCGAKGDVFDLVAAHVQDREGQRAFFAAQGWCSAAGSTSWTARQAPKREVAELRWPDPHDLHALLRACRPATKAPSTWKWLNSRGLTVNVPVGVLPDVYPWPRWWQHREHVLVCSMVDAKGRVVTMHGRYPGSTPMGKTRWPSGCRASPCFFANAAARAMLRGAASPSRTVVLEGMTDFLVAACRAPEGVAVMGAENGSWAALGSCRITGDVALAPDCHDKDATGDRYWREGKAALPRAERLLLPGDAEHRWDVGDVLGNRWARFEDLWTMRAG